MSQGKGDNTAKRTNFEKFNEGYDKLDMDDYPESNMVEVSPGVFKYVEKSRSEDQRKFPRAS